MDGDERLALLLDAAVRLFYERGYHAVSLRNLAKEVGISVSSLYYYFDSKESLLFQLMMRAVDALIARTRGAIEANAGARPTERLHAAIVAFVSFNIDDKDLAHLIMREYRTLEGEQKAAMRRKLKECEALIHGLVRECVECDEAELENTTMTTYLILNACGNVSAWYRPDGKVAGPDVARIYADLLIRMVSAGPTGLRAG